MYLTQSLHRSLQQFPDSPMTVYGDRVRTTVEVADRVARLAGALRGLGVGPGDRVGILSLNSDRFHEYLLATWWIGAVAQPFNIRWSPAEIAYAITDASTDIMFVDDMFAAHVPAMREHCPSLKSYIHCGDGPTPAGTLGYEELVATASGVPDMRVGSDALAVLLYTGGTTGVPKGVAISHRAMLTSLLGSNLASRSVERGGVNLLTAPLFHIAALLGWHSQNLVGGTQVFLATFTPSGFLEAVSRHRVTTCILVPTMVQAVCDQLDREAHDVSSLRTITYGAAATSGDLLQRAMNVFPNAGFTQGYGMTETGVLTFLGREEHIEGGPRLRSVGRATPTVELTVVDPSGREVPAGQVGEIVTRGDHLMLGYWKKPDQTSEAVRDGWMHTGDAGYLDDDGYLYIVDRLKDMIITGGENVYSAEVENALAAHPAVASCAVIGVPDIQWGERVHAVVVLRSGHSVTADEIRAHSRTLIAAYKAPRTVEFVEAIPTSAAGKILKRELRTARVHIPVQPPSAPQ